MTGFHIVQQIGGAWRLVDLLNQSVATFGDNVCERDALFIAQALNDAAEQPAQMRRAAGYIEQFIAGLPCDEVPDELVCALVALGSVKGCK